MSLNSSFGRDKLCGLFYACFFEEALISLTLAAECCFTCETVVSFLKIFQMMTAKCHVAFNHLALPPGRLCLPQIDFLAVSLFDVKIKLDDFFPSLS